MKVIEVAKKYLGLKEDPNNSFKKGTLLGDVLHKAGQKDGESWCSYFMEAVFCEAHPELDTALRKLFDAGAVKTYTNFKAAGYDCHATPRVGDLMIMQKYAGGVKQWQGHAGLVVFVHPTEGWWKCIEGNTTKAGGREGGSGAVLEITRNSTVKKDGLNVLGFVTIPKK
jgi:hypothetical protein